MSELDRMDVRRTIGAAVKKLQEINERPSVYEDTDTEMARLRDILNKARDELTDYRDKLSEAREEQREPLAKVIEDAKEAHKDFSLDGDEMPMLCQVTGLAIFDDDEVYGDREYTSLVLKKAVAPLFTVDTGDAAKAA